MRPLIHVLLVEDDEAEAFHFEKMLGESLEAEFDVTRVVALRSALTVLELKDIDIILLDLSLPGTHGYETVIEFTRRTDIPFIVLTGNDDMQMAMRTTKLGAQDYLLKNEIKSKTLERTICMALGKASSDREKRRRSYRTLSSILPPEQASVALLQPRVMHLIEAIEDLEEYLRLNAPNVLEDVTSLLDKHKVQDTIRETRDILRMEKNGAQERKRSISDAAMSALDDVSRSRTVDSIPPASWEEAEAVLDELAAKGTGRG